MRTIIHIGQHKTGTTSIQYYLRSKRRKLEKRGLYVPDSLAGYNSSNHSILNVHALNQNRSSPMKDKLLATKNSNYFKGLEKQLECDILEHYQNAATQECENIIWTNEGLYLLNSTEEYKRLIKLFDKYSSEITCVCSLREVESYRNSYCKQLKKQGIDLSSDKDSYRYVEPDSWLFDYKRKEELLRQVFDQVISFSYNKDNMVETFMKHIGYPVTDGGQIRLNITKTI